jgi:hypothetical protein
MKTKVLNCDVCGKEIINIDKNFKLSWIHSFTKNLSSNCRITHSDKSCFSNLKVKEGEIFCEKEWVEVKTKKLVLELCRKFSKLNFNEAGSFFSCLFRLL